MSLLWNIWLNFFYCTNVLSSLSTGLIVQLQNFSSFYLCPVIQHPSTSLKFNPSFHFTCTEIFTKAMGKCAYFKNRNYLFFFFEIFCMHDTVCSNGLLKQIRKIPGWVSSGLDKFRSRTWMLRWHNWLIIWLFITRVGGKVAHINLILYCQLNHFLLVSKLSHLQWFYSSFYGL